ncbi:Npun_F0494 family protein [Spirulina major]|uniref:Npun_F0494 family protein n=1 Tax=Spirulina major TaxID=270636 RepID=UPI00093360E5|nr:Npun_F0494 family protein [Spirulina major]
MTSSSSIRYSARICDRAARALRCSPFTLALLLAIRTTSVALDALAGTAGVTQAYTRTPLTEWQAESQMMWLIQVGLVRREVDGQGITDSFRLTPLGWQLTQAWSDSAQGIPPATWGDRFLNWIHRWFRLPL